MKEDVPITEISHSEIVLSPPRYDLTPEELRSLELDLVNEIKISYPEEGISAVWIGPNHKYANILRNHEANLFPEVTELPQDIEDRSLFLALVDTRKGEDRVVHATTISGVLGRKAGEPNPYDPDGPVTSGFIVIDDLIGMGNFTCEEFLSYYKEAGIDLSSSMSVETNFAVGERVEKFKGLSTPDIAYLSLFRLLEMRAKDLGTAVVFASINDKSINSFERVGITCSPLMGRNDLVTSESLDGLDFKPVVIPNNASIFSSIDLEIPELVFDANLVR